jgi:hypothetical protein
MPRQVKLADMEGAVTYQAKAKVTCNRANYGLVVKSLHADARVIRVNSHGDMRGDAPWFNVHVNPELGQNELEQIIGQYFEIVRVISPDEVSDEILEGDDPLILGLENEVAELRSKYAKLEAKYKGAVARSSEDKNKINIMAGQLKRAKGLETKLATLASDNESSLPLSVAEQSLANLSAVMDQPYFENVANWFSEYVKLKERYSSLIDQTFDLSDTDIEVGALRSVLGELFQLNSSRDEYLESQNFNADELSHELDSLVKIKKEIDILEGKKVGFRIDVRKERQLASRGSTSGTKVAKRRARAIIRDANRVIKKVDKLYDGLKEHGITNIGDLPEHIFRKRIILGLVSEFDNLYAANSALHEHHSNFSEDDSEEFIILVSSAMRQARTTLESAIDD